MTSDSAIWASLPIPAFLIDGSDNIADVNSAGEGFLNASAKSVIGTPIWDQVAIDAPIEEALGAPARTARRFSSMTSTSAPAAGRRCNARCRSRRFSDTPAP